MTLDELNAALAERKARNPELGTDPFTFTYTNHRGVTSVRHVIPASVHEGFVYPAEFRYPDDAPEGTPRTVFDGFDADRGGARRTFRIDRMTLA